jgi:carboxyl-terminal processing protease
MSTQNKNTAIYLPILLAVFLVAGMFIGTRMKPVGTKQSLFIYPKTDKFNTVLNYIESEYVDSVSRDELVETAIPAVLSDLDPHSIYIPANELQAVNEPLEGNFEGIGVQFNMPNDTVVIVSVISGGPSEKVGIMAGDRIMTINDSVVAGKKIPQDDIVRKLKGPMGTSVNVGIKRHGPRDLVNFTVVRGKIPLYSVDVAYMVTSEIGYIKISKFSKTTFEEFTSAVEKLKNQGMKKMVLDLRENSGGYMDAATNIADQFLGDNELIVYTEGRTRPRVNIYSKPGGICLEEEVAVLIDEWSASASEILAGALQDNDRGIIVGRRSFGKGLVQEPILLNDGSAIRLTIARYYTPTGRSIQKPYKKGSSDYYNDISERYQNGELLVKDSIQFNDSLRFTTPKGKVVYGGGGIMPDVFIPMDTVGFTTYFHEVRNRGLVYRFAFEYADRNRDKLDDFTSWQGIDHYLDQQNIYYDFSKYVESQGVRGSVKDRSISKNIIYTQLKATIARNILDNDGFYPIIHRIDNTFQRSVELLKTMPEYEGHQ